MSPNVSIIIPHYNMEMLLEKLLKSIPDYNGIQVIVVDDNSCEQSFDRIKKIINESRLPDIKLYRNDGQKGAGTCRNIGLKHAVGKWILFADSDDYFISGFYDVIKQYLNSDNEIVYFVPTSRFIDSDKEADRHIRIKEYLEAYVLDRNLKNELMVRYKFYEPWSKLVKLSFIREHNIAFDETMTCNDQFFSILCGYYATKIEVCESVIYVVTRCHGGLSTHYSEERARNSVDIFIKRYNFMKLHLDVYEFEMVEMHGISVLVDSLRCSFKSFLYTINMLRKNNVEIFHKGFFLPNNMYKRALRYYKYYINSRQYIS